MPRSRSRSMRSSTCSRISRSATVLVICSMRSASVDFPWSMWAIMEKLRMWSKRPMDTYSSAEPDRCPLCLSKRSRGEKTAGQVGRQPIQSGYLRSPGGGACDITRRYDPESACQDPSDDRKHRFHWFWHLALLCTRSMEVVFIYCQRCDRAGGGCSGYQCVCFFVFSLVWHSKYTVGIWR
jgi:hypothetical protein